LLTSNIRYIAFAIVVLSGACDTNKVVTPDNGNNPEVERVVGFYKAITFIELGRSDGGVDILAGGGILVAQLYADFSVEGYYSIPDTVETSFPPRDMLYKGTFELTDDTLRFHGTDVAGLEFLPFIVYDDRLETPDIINGIRIGPDKVELTRK